MLVDVAITIMDKLEKELQETEPEKREKFIEKAVSLLELSARSIMRN
ncbi:MAG: hypothetical protein ACOWWO_08525 [Peptococcaceae bacterium]